MRRFAVKMGWVMVVLAMVLVASPAALAQRGEGRGGRGPGGPDGRGFGPGRGMPPSAMRLVTMDAVQEVLKLSDEQKDKVAEIDEELRQRAREAFGERRGERPDFGRVRGEMQKLNEEATAKLIDVLDDHQKRQLAAIVIEVSDAGALLDPLVAAQLNITAEQKEKMAEIRDAQQPLQAGFGGRRAQELSREEMRELRAKMEERRAEVHKQLMTVLTSEQQQQFETLKGEAADVELRPRGFRQRPGAEERRGERQRDRDRTRRGRDRGGESSSDDPV